MSTCQVPAACVSGNDFLGPAGGNRSMLLQCQLVNLTYSVAFDYVNGNQTVAIEVPRTALEEPVTAISNITGPTNASCVGFHAGYLLSQSSPPTEYPDWPERCDFDPGLARQLAYKSIFDAFFNMISGPVALDQSSAGNILATTLLGTRELDFLTNYARAMDSDTVEWNNAHSALFAAGRADVAGLVAPALEDKRPALTTELERTFQNVTVSLMSSTAFQPNLTDTAKLPQTKVKTQTYHNVYVYTARRLWIAYALAASCAIISVALGLHTIVATGASYSKEFSTILRVSRHAHLDHEVSRGAAGGQDPLPKYLAKATLTVIKQDDTASSSAEQKTPTTSSYQLLSPGEERSFGTSGSRTSL